MTLPDRYILYRRVWDPAKSKWKKIPCDEHGTSIDANDPRHWRSLGDRKAQATWGETEPAKPYGVGFAFNGDGHFLIDLDDCLEDGKWSEEAEGIYRSFSGALGEVSTSGNGLHIIGKCDPSRVATLRNKWAGNKEFYHNKRFVALSREGPQPIGTFEPEKDWTDHLLNLVPSRDVGTSVATHAHSSAPQHNDEALLARAMRSKSVAASFGGGVTFRDLWDASAEPLSMKYPSYGGENPFDHSSADAALMQHLAFWTAKDATQMDRLFRRSSLMRDKYGKRQDYRDRTIQNAIQRCKEVYQPAQNERPALEECEWPGLPEFLQNQSRPAPPDLDVETLFSADLSACLLHMAEARGGPVDYVAFSFLVGCASLVGNAVKVAVHDGWKEPCILWAVCIGAPSAGKTPAISVITDIVSDLEAPLRKAAQGALDKWQLDKMAAEAAASIWRAEIKRAAKNNAPLPTPPKSVLIPTMPNLPRLLVTDVTVEKLSMICAAQPKGTLAFRDELSGFLQNMERYSGGSSDRPFWLEAYNGKPFCMERVSRDPVSIPALSVSVLGGIQPDRLATLLLSGDDDGLLARMLPIWPLPAPIERFNGGAVDAKIRKVLERLAKLEVRMNADDCPIPHVIEFDDASQEEMLEFRREMRERESTSGKTLVSFLGKLPGYVARIALVIELIEWAKVPNGGPLPRKISTTSVSKAITLAQTYLIPMAERTYAGGGQSDFENKRKRLIETLANYNDETISARQLQRMGNSSFPNKRALQPLLENLVDVGLLCEVQPPKSLQGGRPSQRYTINPKLKGWSP